MMNRLHFTLSLCALCISLIATPLAGADKPNILFIAVDDLGSQLGCYGDLMAKTPHIDQLSASGVRFDHAYNQIPLCNPTRASVMTGRRPDEIQVYDLDRHFREALPEAVTISQYFMQQGYFAGRVGKIYHYNVPAAIGSDGFDDPLSWQKTINPYGRDKIDEQLIFNAEPHRKISGALSWLAAEGTDEEQTDGMIATEAIAMMESQKDRPFFVAAGFFRPHTPYVAPKKYFDMHPLESIRLPYAPADDRDDIPPAAFAHNCPIPNYNLDDLTLRKAVQAYYATVSFIDAQIGRMLNALEDFGLAENTIVVFWSDHGYHLGEHDGVWQKRTLFEQSAAAPLIIRAPGVDGNGTASPGIAEFVDIYPTLVDLAFEKLPEDVKLSGRSLVPLLKDPTRTDWQHHAVTQILRPGVGGDEKPVMGRSIRTKRWRYTDWAEGAAGEELYDHHGDPMEFRNLALDPDPAAQAVIAELRSLLEKKASGKVPATPFNSPRL